MYVDESFAGKLVRKGEGARKKQAHDDLMKMWNRGKK
jgi:hypothetical protein